MTDTRAYSEGWDAWLLYWLRLSDNPYPPNTPDHDAWRNGYLDAIHHYVY